MKIRHYYILAAVAGICLFFTIPEYRIWLTGNILNPPVSYQEQFSHQDPEERRVLRYGNTYRMDMQTADFFRQNNLQDVLLLLPPTEYLKANGVVNFSVVEPAMFYYYTGYKSVGPYSADVEKANWVMVPKPPIVMLRRIYNRADLRQLLTQYKPYMY